MIILDKPYVSSLLRDSVIRNGFPVIRTDTALAADVNGEFKFLDDRKAVELYIAGKEKLYTNSENAIAWITENLQNSELPKQIALFKDKAAMRELLKPLFPDYYFQKVSLEELTGLSFADIRLPIIVKPAIGFFSMGVYKITGKEDWLLMQDAVAEEMEKVKGIYPREVMDGSTFIIEELIEGDEYAVDVYFDREGEPVITNIMYHIFGSASDVSDRVYITSADIIKENLSRMENFLRQVGSAAGLHDFPAHVEVRVDDGGRIIPIEVNPMRFGGWCSTGDMAALAYDFDPYLYYFSEQKPDWPELLKGKENKIFSIIILDNSTGIETRDIAEFDYEKAASPFSGILQLRKIDFREYPVFGFLFVETSADEFSKVEYLLKSNLREFITLKKK